MGAKTAIEWTGSTWTPIRARNRKTSQEGWHCTKPSAGCKNCYAEALNKRLGTGLPFVANADTEIFLDQKILLQPLHWKKPRRIFVCSMTDIFGEFVPIEALVAMFEVMGNAPQHTFQVLTKRPERMREFVHCGLCDIVPKNIWLGVSVENQAAADERIPILLQTPAAVRFLSIEPLLEPINLDIAFADSGAHGGPSPCANPTHRHIDWVIVGGESGQNARPCNIAWIESIVSQCRAARVPIFIKQIGAWPTEAGWNSAFKPLQLRHRGKQISPFLNLRDRKGGDPSEWPEALHIQEYPARNQRQKS